MTARKVSYSEIEALLQNRKVAQARVLLKRYWRTHRGSLTALAQVCEGYRRTGDWELGLKLVRLHKVPSQELSVESDLGLRALWAARFLNLAGASSFALRVAEKLQAQRPENLRVLANIFLSNFEYEKAAHLFEKLFLVAEKPLSYSHRIALIEWGDSLAGLGDIGGALKRVDQSQKLSTEPLIQNICLAARGEYLARSEDFKQALTHFEKASQAFAPNDTGLDHAFLKKWWGYACFKTGHRTQGQKLWNEAEPLLRRPGRDEIWLDFLRLKARVGELNKTEMQRLLSFPLIPPGLSPQIEGACGEKIDAPREFKAPGQAEITIYLGEHECTLHSKRYAHLPKELELLGWLRVLGPWGLSRIKARALLWPGEFFSFFALDARLEQLVFRLRHTYGLKIENQEGRLILDKSHNSHIAATTGGLRPGFLCALRVRGQNQFRAHELSTYYEVQKTQRSALLEQWIDNAWVKAHGSTRNRVYIVND